MLMPAFGSLRNRPSASSRRFLLAVMIALTVFGLWGHFGVLDIISMAQGEVIPSTQIKKIQHLEGGIVRRIFVHEGEMVAEGQSLVELEASASGADVGELQARLMSLRAEIIRLEAEAAGREELKFTPEELRELGDRVGQARELFASRRLNLRNATAGQSEIVVQRQKDMQEIQARLHHSQKRIAMIREQVNISEELLKSDITNRYGHLDLLKELNLLQSRIEEDTAALGRAEAMHKEANVQLKAVRGRHDEEVSKQLETARRDWKEYQARLGKFEDNYRRTVVKSPVQGVVKVLHVATLGGVVRPGETLLEIVPEGDELVIEARLPIQDIGFVALGQAARIRLLSMDAARFGEIAGTVVHVSPDTLVTREGNPFYKVRVQTAQGFFASKGQVYRLVPGMILQVAILTGHRTILEYLTAPFLNARFAALGER